MSRYIDVDKFAEKICNFQAIDEDAANAMIWLLRTFPTADVVEVVRCRDCVCGNNNMPDRFFCDYFGTKVDENHYCSYGERREG